MNTAQNLFEQNGFLTVRQAAEKLGVSRSKVYELIKAGELRLYKIFAKKGMVKEVDLQTFIAKRLEVA